MVSNYILWIRCKEISFNKSFGSQVMTSFRPSFRPTNHAMNSGDECRRKCIATQFNSSFNSNCRSRAQIGRQWVTPIGLLLSTNLILLLWQVYYSFCSRQKNSFVTSGRIKLVRRWVIAHVNKQSLLNIWTWEQLNMANPLIGTEWANVLKNLMPISTHFFSFSFYFSTFDKTLAEASNLDSHDTIGQNKLRSTLDLT